MLRDKLLNELKTILDAQKLDFNLKPHADSILSQLHSPRTQLCMSAFTVTEQLYGRIDADIDCMILMHMLKLAGSTKKMILGETSKMLRTIGDRCTAPLRMFPIICQEFNDKNVSVRSRVVEVLLYVLSAKHSVILSDAKTRQLAHLTVRRAIGDASPEVRYLAAQCFLLLSEVNEEMAFSLFDQLDGSTKRQLSMALSKLEKDESSILYKRKYADKCFSEIASVPMKIEHCVEKENSNNSVMLDINDWNDDSLLKSSHPDFISTAAESIDEVEAIHDPRTNGINALDNCLEVNDLEDVVEKVSDDVMPRAKDDKTKFITSPGNKDEDDIISTCSSDDIIDSTASSSNAIDESIVLASKEHRSEASSDMDVEEDNEVIINIHHKETLMSMDLDIEAFEKVVKIVEPLEDLQVTNSVLASPRSSLRERFGLTTSTPLKASSTLP